MCVQHATSPPAPDVPALSRRGVLRAATAGAVAVGAAGLLARPAAGRAPPRRPAVTAAAAAGCRSTGSASSSTPCATSSRSTSPAPSPRWPRSATPGSSTPASSAAPRPQFRAALDAAGLRATSGHVGIPQPFDAAAWQRALADAHASARGTSCTRSSASTRTARSATRRRLPRVRPGPQPGRRAGQAGRARVRLPQPPLRVLPARRRRPHRVRHPHRGDRPATWCTSSWTCSGLARRRATRST